MSKRKLQRFAEMETFSNVFQPEFKSIFNTNFYLKGNWHKMCFENDNPIILELGCGKGEYTVGLASLFGEMNFIGIDIKGARIWKGARQALDQQLHNVRFIRTHIEQVSSFFGHNEVSEIWLTFPDPQPKKKRKRLTSSRFLNAFSQFMKNNGIIHLKTDNHLLYHYTLELVKENQLKIRYETNDLYRSDFQNEILQIKTFYEQQFLDQGLNINYLSFELPHDKTIIEPPE